MTIRPEVPGDIPAIEGVHIAAFAVHPFSHQTEHLIVNALRADGALAVSLVAELGGRVVGHIAFSAIRIDGCESRWFILGPVGVLPELQRQGIGRALVGIGLDAIDRLGAEGCILVGDPAYYTRFGFARACGLVLEGVPPEVFLCLRMSGGMPRGVVSCHAAFLVTASSPTPPA